MSPSLSIFIVASEDKTNEDEISSENDKSEFVVDYKLFVKIANRVLLSAKWFKES
ncbi:28683_t:CDS:1, partial [Racocetra persica]